jgi:CheY-like chemotaxis protein
MEAMERQETFCAVCASSVEAAVVLRDRAAYCSYECAIAGTPARRVLRIGHHSADPVASLRAGLIQGVDVVLADADAEPLDGFAVAAILRAEKGTAGIPVLIVTSRDDPLLRARAAKAGAAGLLLRPQD